MPTEIVIHSGGRVLPRLKLRLTPDTDGELHDGCNCPAWVDLTLEINDGVTTVKVEDIAIPEGQVEEIVIALNQALSDARYFNRQRHA